MSRNFCWQRVKNQVFLNLQFITIVIQLIFRIPKGAVSCMIFFLFAYFVTSIGFFLPSSYFIYAYLLDDFLITYPYPQLLILTFDSLPSFSTIPVRHLHRNCYLEYS